MFRAIVFSAFGAALAAAVAVSALQSVTTAPLILHAEKIEGGGHGHASAEIHSHDHGDEAVAADGTEADGNWAPADGFERGAYTVVANLVVAFGVSLLLAGLMVLRGGRIDARTGLLWGAGGFVVAALLPSLGLPPELPGTPAADLVARQSWWLLTVTASAGGLALLVFAAGWPLRILGLVLIVAPHVIGAPVPPSHEVSYPGGLAAEFVIASLVVSAVLWTLSGLASGWLLERMSRTG